MRVAWPEFLKSEARQPQRRSTRLRSRGLLARLWQRNLRFAGRQFARAWRRSLRSPGREIVRAAYIEVHTVLRYVYLFVPLLYLPFTIYDLIARWAGWSLDARMVYFDLVLYTILLGMGWIFSASRAKRLSIRALRWQCAIGVLLFSMGGTSATILQFRLAQELSLFSGVLLAIAILFRFPDNTKFFIYVLNYVILYTFLYMEDVRDPVLLQNPLFILLILLLFDRVTFFSMANSYSRNRRILKLNRLMRAEDRNKSDMISIAVHDLKSPVTGIMSVSTLLRESPGGFSESERDEILAEVQKSSRNILGHIEDLVDIAQSGIAGPQLRYSDFDLSEALYAITHNFQHHAAAKGIELYTRFAHSESQTVYSDRRAITRILENLISNAIKYTPPGGTVLVGSRLLVSRAAADGQADRVAIEIADEGPGFTREDRAKLFGRLERLSARPTGGESSSGIGLYAVRKLVDGLQGVSLRLEENDSESGSGARFRLELPFVRMVD